MAVTHCGHCGSVDTEVETNLVFCFACGGKTDCNGNPLPGDPQFSAPNFQERRAAGEVQ